MPCASRSRVFFHCRGAAALLLAGLGCPSGATLRSAESSAPTAAEPATPARVASERGAPNDALGRARERARALVSEMTLEEKLAAIVHVWDWSHEKSPQALCATTAFGPGSFERIGLHRDPATTASFVNELTACVTARSRQHIPPFLLDEGVHGFMQKGATVFPVALGLGATFNPELVREVFAAVAREARSRGTTWILGPNLDLAREPRWGRMDEMYGEDPYLVTRLGVAAIRGLQGDVRPIGEEHVLATAKHFAAHGQPESGANGGPVNISERILRSEFFGPFDAAVHEASVAAVMAAYNEIDGVPGHINAWLLRDVLRDEWHFDGLVISDGMGIERLESVHRVSRSRAESARKALLAGIDFEIGTTFLELTSEVAAQRAPTARIDEAAEHTLSAKFELGLFDAKPLDPARAAAINNSEAHQKLALEAARQAAVLLQNDGILPLDRSKLRRIAVVGPNAALAHVGGYSADAGRGVSLLDGIRAAVGKNIEVRYARGCNITSEDLTWEGFWKGKVSLPDPKLEPKLIEEAVRAVRGTDVALVAIGENEATSRETWDNHLGDRDSLALLGLQNELVSALAATGVPLVLVIVGGRPLEIGGALEKSRAALETFYLGQEGGTALAELVFGDVAPSGHLPITWPKNVGQLPVYYYKRPSAGGDYLFSEAAPLYPFGWGLTYTTFAHSDLRVEPASIRPGEKATLTVTVTNTGKRAATDVVQLYIGAKTSASNITRPVRLARGFERVPLSPGEARRVSFEIGPDDLEIWNLSMQRSVEPGTYVLEVGSNSAELQGTTLEVQGPPP